MKLSIFTIVLDGFPWITKHLPIFQQLKCDWEWIVVHGAAMNNGSTRWCKEQESRLSADGTTEYLRDNQWQMRLVENPRWNSKDQMVNAALHHVTEPCVLMEIDADEVWEPWQLDAIVTEFETDKGLDAMQFACEYFVGQHLITSGKHCYGDMDYEWWRAWRYEPRMRFASHEPPKLDRNGKVERVMLKNQTGSRFKRFNHYAYATEAQVAYKEKFYGYDGLLEGWSRLQEVRDFPVKLSDYFPQCHGDLPLVVRV